MNNRPLKIWCGVRLGDAEKALLLARTTGHEVVFAAPAELALLGPTGAKGFPSDADILFGQPDAAALLEITSLRWVHLSTAGYTRYDTAEFRAAASAQKLPVTNSSSVFAEPCAQQVLAYMLAHERALPESLADRSGTDTAEWRALRARCGLLKNKNVLILGYGAIARRIAELLAPFGVRISATRRTPRGGETIPVVSDDRIHEALAAADHVVNTLPANAATKLFMNSERFTAMKPGAVFHNIGRGDTVDQEALAGALRTGRLAAAWLDVTSPEPLPADHPLRALANCHITPHTGGGHGREEESLVQHFADNLDRFVAGNRMHDRVM